LAGAGEFGQDAAALVPRVTGFPFPVDSLAAEPIGGFAADSGVHMPGRAFKPL
jgi:hypothetical protein